MINCQSLFAHSDLMLLDWSRFDDVIHAKGLDLLAEFVHFPEFRNDVMPLLRPAGRAAGWYRPDGDGRRIFGGARGDVPEAPMLQYGDKEGPGLCELWLQVADAKRSQVLDRLHCWREANNHGRFWWDARTPLWSPFGKGPDEDYVRNALAARGASQHVICRLSDDERAWLLKLMWYRASVEIAGLWRRNGRRMLGGNDEVADLMGDILADILLSDFGFPTGQTVIDPTEVAASHIPAYAANSLMPHARLTGRTCDLLENISGGAWASRPFDAIVLGCVADRAGFLTQLRARVDWEQL